MPLFDYECPECHTILRDVLRPEYAKCGQCPGQPPMVKMPAAPSFTIHGFNAKNGYAK